ncbi:MAG: thiopurine S-methyltransferase [Candidatus Macondimonas sp.]
MDPDFWLARWARGEIGFHRASVHPMLNDHGAALAGRRVLAPLCGKSLDLAHLADMGCTVVGVELSEQAIAAFFAERGLAPQVTVEARCTRWVAGSYILLQGDYFTLTTADLGAPCTGLYDRAALIALPSALRPAYAAQTAKLLAPGAFGLLITLDYPQEAMDGPPFAVPEAEVRALYGAFAGIQSLAEEDALDAEPRFREQGLSRLSQCAYALRFAAL